MTQNYLDQITDTTLESGNDLASRLNDFDTAHKSNQSGASRPSGISAGGIWTKDNGGGSYTLMLFDGASDIALATLNSPSFTGSPRFNGVSNAATIRSDLGLEIGVDVAPETKGIVAAFAANSPPTGWLECDGSTISRTTYAALFAVIGTTFGSGDGSTTFEIPDLRGEFIRGWDNGRGVDGSRAFGSAQSDELKSHVHGGVRRASTDSGGVNAIAGTSTPNTSSLETNATGGSETRPRNIALMFCIKY